MVILHQIRSRMVTLHQIRSRMVILHQICSRIVILHQIRSRIVILHQIRSRMVTLHQIRSRVVILPDRNYRTIYCRTGTKSLYKTNRFYSSPSFNKHRNRFTISCKYCLTHSAILSLSLSLSDMCALCTPSDVCVHFVCTHRCVCALCNTLSLSLFQMRVHI